MAQLHRRIIYYKVNSIISTCYDHRKPFSDDLKIVFSRQSTDDGGTAEAMVAATFGLWMQQYCKLQVLMDDCSSRDYNNMGVLG